MELVTFTKLKEIILSYLPKNQFNKIKQAYLFAKKAHFNQKRHSGEDYIHHPLEVTKYLAELRSNLNTLIAGILHDVVEDCEITLEQISDLFGKDVANLVDGVTKITTISKNAQDKNKQATMKKIFLSGVFDIRILIIKICDRLHNVKTLFALPPQKRILIAQETLQIYSPLALKLSLFEIKQKLENFAFKWAYSSENQSIEKKVKYYRQIGNKYLSSVVNKIKNSLENQNINHTILSRLKTNYAIYKKLYIKGRRWEKIKDFFALRIVTTSIDDCYRALGVLHKTFLPIPKTFKDYIALPKHNGYQSIHTAFNYKGMPFEAQIRTKAMDIKASIGVAADFFYKEKNQIFNLQKEFEAKNKWLIDLQALSKENLSDFVEDTYARLSARNIYVTTPENETIIMPLASTVIDFAYKIHSSIGNYFYYAIINGEKMGPEQIIVNGWQIKIVTHNLPQVQENWLSFATTKSAIRGIKNGLVKVAKDYKHKFEYYGKLVLEMLLSKSQIKKIKISFVAKKFNLSLHNFGDFYEAIGRKIIPIKELSTINEMISLVNLLKNERITNQIYVEDNKKTRFVIIANCCKAIPGDHIFGLRTKDIVKIHVYDCKLKVKENKVNVRWVNVLQNNEELHEVCLKIYLEKNKNFILNQIFSKLISLNAPIIDFVKPKTSQLLVVLVTLLVKDLSNLNQVVTALEKIMFIKKVTR